ncbi:MAG: hypothetical protein ACLTW9_22525 [Enterocloster sp.]
MKRPEPEMGSGGFCLVYQEIQKARFFFFGVKNEEKGLTASLHNPRFDIDEDAMVPALAVYINTLYHLLERQVCIGANNAAVEMAAVEMTAVK